jgi:Tol biopolymer transport system component
MMASGLRSVLIEVVQSSSIACGWGPGPGNPEQLTSDSMAAFWADWSPDGREIAFHKFLGDHRQIFVMSSDGSSPVQVTKGADDERSPDWSPDGKHLILIANLGTNQRCT